MNKIKSLAIALIASAAALTSCSDYLEVKLDEQLTLDEIFSKRATTLQYLRHCYSYLPFEAEALITNGVTNNVTGSDGAVIALSDEAHFGWTTYVPHLNIKTGDFGPASPDFLNWNNWPILYTGIEQCGIFMQNINRCPQMTAKEKKEAYYEAKAIRAYCYFQLFRKFGPVFVWGDRRSEQTISPASIDRNTVEENVDFMVREFDACLEGDNLPIKVDDPSSFEGRITRGAILAAKSRLLLYAASPLFNGCDLYKGKLMNKDGKYLFPQTPDPNKWELAAQAAKAVIDFNGGMYQLYEDETETDPFQKAIKSYQGIQFNAWNSEIIWGYWPRCSPYNAAHGLYPAYHWGARMTPPKVIRQGCAGYCPSLKLVDTYPMAESGRYPVTGYKADLTPIVDEKSGYVHDGFTDNWIHPMEGEKFGGIKAHNSLIGRDARFYASIFASGMYWINEFTEQNKKMIVTFHSTGTSPYTNITADCCKVGYLWRRFLNPENDYQNNQWGTFFWFYYRLGEIYLNYAEACNEKPNRDEGEALKYVNKIRNRAGLNNLEEAYPEVIGNKELLRQLLRKERMVELAWEGHRYYDCRRWMIATEEMDELQPTLNVPAGTYEDSYKRINTAWNRKSTFEDKHYFMPIAQPQVNEMVNITQNYGW